MRSPARPTRPITRVDVAASLLSKVAPRPLVPHIDQARRDLRAVVDGLLGRNELSYRSEQHPSRPPPALSDIDPIEHSLPQVLRPRYLSLKRDATVVLRGLAGEHPSPLIERKPRKSTDKRSLATAATSTSHRMRIEAVTRETADAITLTLADVTGARTVFAPGQFLSVRADVAGETLWRAYSICTCPSSGKLAITIKRVADGRVSNHLNDHAHVGQVLEVRGPSGRFTLRPSTTARHIALIGGGSGITPLISHARHWLEQEPHTRVTLLYGNRRLEDIVFREALSELVRAYAGRFTLRHVLSEPAPSFAAGLGMLDRATTARELETLGLVDDERTVYLICGPEPMMDAARAVLLARGVAEERIHEERFTAPTTTPVKQAYTEQLVTVRVKGKDASVRVPAGQTILEAATAQNVPLEFSCTMGGCGACMAHLVDGSVDMEEPNCLSKAEREDGKILTCVARPTSPCRVEQGG
jgi:ferredoxin-NADP reductase